MSLSAIELVKTFGVIIYPKEEAGIDIVKGDESSGMSMDLLSSDIILGIISKIQNRKGELGVLEKNLR